MNATLTYGYKFNAGDLKGNDLEAFLREADSQGAPIRWAPEGSVLLVREWDGTGILHYASFDPPIRKHAHIDSTFMNAAFREAHRTGEAKTRLIRRPIPCADRLGKHMTPLTTTLHITQEKS